MKKNFRLIYHLLFLSFIFILSQQSLADTKKSDKENEKSSDNIAVAATGKSETSKISDKAGRAPYFLIFDSNGDLIKSIKNPALGKKGGASSIVTNLLKKESVKILIANKFGDKMENNLKASKIDYQKQTGIAKEVIEKFIKNKRSKNDKE
jgi:predicted Fe-Mo cluster-binding NifX family protein